MESDPTGPEHDDAALPWDARIRRLVDFGVDASLVAENLRRTPTERLRRLEDMLRFLEENRVSAGRPR